MNPPNLEPIPTPFTLRWREVLHTAVPSLVFVSVLAVCALIWSSYAVAPTLVGQVEALSANVVSTQPGLLARLTVEQFASVRAGDLIADVVITEPKILESSLAVIRAEADMLSKTLSPLAEVDQSHWSYFRLRLYLLQEQTDLAMAQARRQYAQAEFDRAAIMIKDPTQPISQSQYDLAKRDLDVATSETSVRSQAVAELERNLKAYAALQGSGTLGDAAAEAMRTAIALQEKKLEQAEAQLGPLHLKAPIDGTVSLVHHRNGENITAGVPIVTIIATNSARIIGYVLQPTPAPKVGGAVEVVTRSLPRGRARGSLLQVSDYMEVVPPTIFNPLNSNARGLGSMPMNTASRPVEIGIPVAVTLPPELHLRPGELVDLRILGSKN